MKDTILKPNSLVLYKGQPARVLNLGAKKVTIEVDEGSSIDVRYKDIQLLHIGPLNSLSELRSVSGELQTAWELLEGETTDLEALADLIYDEVSPATVWSTWALVADGLYFRGEPAHIYVRTLEEVETTLLERENKERELAAWNSFIQRVSQEDYAEEDEPLLQDTVDLAL
ncbi:MAG: RNB domain-containing ribonuclease, partial [Candidatus Promineifilaceae bacterium]